MIGAPFSTIPIPLGRRIDTRSSLSIGGGCGSLGTLSTGTPWPTANKALFVPFRIPCAVSVIKISFYNGATVSGNFDVGIYSADGTRLASSGSTAQASPNGVQSATLSVTLGAGMYYLALALDNTSGTIRMYNLGGISGLARILGALEQASAFPLPATATFAAYTTITSVPLISLEIAPNIQQWSPDISLPALPTVHPWSIESCGTFFAAANAGLPITALASRTYNNTTGRARMWRFAIGQKTRFQRILVLNGNTVAGNLDVGIYTADGRRIVSSGAVAQAGVNALQVFTIAATTLDPGEFWMAIVNSDSTSTTMTQLLASPNFNLISAMFHDASGAGIPLPATVTIGDNEPDVITVMALSQRTVN